MNTRQVALALVIVAALGSTAPAQTRCPVQGGVAERVGEVDASERVRFLEASLARGARKAAIWNWSWPIIYGVLAGGQVAVGLVIDDEGRKKDLYVSAARAGIAGLAGILIPLKAPREWRRYRATGDACADVAAAERALAAAAASEARGKSWKKHAAVLGLNLVTGLVLWLGFDRPIGQAALTTATGLVVGEVMIFTQPTASRAAWNRYRRGEVGIAATPAVTWTITPLAGGAGIGIAGTF